MENITLKQELLEYKVETSSDLLHKILHSTLAAKLKIIYFKKNLGLLKRLCKSTIDFYSGKDQCDDENCCMFRFLFKILTSKDSEEALTYFPDGSLSLLFILAALTHRYKDDQAMINLGKRAYDKAKIINCQLDSEITAYAQQYFNHPEIAKEF